MIFTSLPVLNCQQCNIFKNNDAKILLSLPLDSIKRNVKNSKMIASENLFNRSCLLRQKSERVFWPINVEMKKLTFGSAVQHVFAKKGGSI